MEKNKLFLLAILGFCIICSFVSATDFSCSDKTDINLSSCSDTRCWNKFSSLYALDNSLVYDDHDFSINCHIHSANDTQRDPLSYIIKIHGISLCKDINCNAGEVYDLGYVDNGIDFDIASVNAGSNVGTLFQTLDLKKLPPEGTVVTYVRLAISDKFIAQGSSTLKDVNGIDLPTCYTNASSGNVSVKGALATNDQTKYGKATIDMSSIVDPATATPSVTDVDFLVQSGKAGIVYWHIPLISNPKNFDIQNYWNGNWNSNTMQQKFTWGKKIPQIKIYAAISKSFVADYVDTLSQHGQPAHYFPTRNRLNIESGSPPPAQCYFALDAPKIFVNIVE